MNLLEISDEFTNPKTNPEQDLSFIEKRQKAIEHELKHVRAYKDQAMKRIAGPIKKAGWGFNNPNDPNQKAELDKIIATGYLPLVVVNQWSGKEEIQEFIPDLPENREVMKKIMRFAKRESALSKMIHNIPTEVKRAKGRLSAWKRKQPTYVSRTTGKELLAEIKKKVEEFIASKNWPVTINNSYYWGKNKMIVIDLPVRTGIDNKTAYEAAKQIVKPELIKFLEELGYSQFRVVDRYYPDSKLTVVKLQLDDVEARNKAGEQSSPPEINGD